MSRSPCPLPSRFHWASTGVVIAPRSDAAHDLVSIKDPTIVHFNGLWHLYATVAHRSGRWSLVYLNFADWKDAPQAEQHHLDSLPAFQGNIAAPQLFYFTPQKKWYLVYQSGQPLYSTADDPSAWQAWTPPRSFFPGEPRIVTRNKGKGEWLDFFVICDETHCYLFFSDDNGHLYRSCTLKSDFPTGFSESVICLSGSREDLFEANAHYKLLGTQQFLTLIEAFSPSGGRYYRSFLSSSLDGEFTPLAASWQDPFADSTNVDLDPPMQDPHISHGELLRAGIEETMPLDPCRLRFLCQVLDGASARGLPYSQLPYRLVLLEGNS